MNILLTGGAGYIGSACLRWLQAHGHDAMAYDDLSAGNAAAVPGSGRWLIREDICDTDRLAMAMRLYRADAVIHLAALASVPGSIADPAAYYRVNVAGTQSVLEAMRQTGVRKILFSSSAAVYDHTFRPLREDSAVGPETPYGYSKSIGERMIEDYARAYEINYVFLRYFNAAGADFDGQHGEHRRQESHLVPLALRVALGEDAALAVFGDDFPTEDGTAIRDYVHVTDLAIAHQKALQSMDRLTHQTYNLGSGTGTSVRKVITACERITGRSIRCRYAPRRPGDPSELVADIGKAMMQLDWRPRHSSIEEIVHSAWEWHRRHPQGYSSRP